ncbi:MAG: hypothetical protein H6Q89_2345 [Myxococcaceae bacterium]|nr:hypothetical protein [Myxococcaceae bacterium]
MKSRKGAAGKKTPPRKPKTRPPVAKKKPRAKILRHDTPVDPAPAAALGAFDPGAAAEQALARVRRIETIEGAYDAWSELRLEYSSLVRKLADERRQLDQQGEFLVGAVRAARDLSRTPTVAEALALAKPGSGLDDYLLQTAGRLEAARQQLEERSRAVEAAVGLAFAQIRDELRGRVLRTLQHVRPKLRLMIRSLGPESRILHVARLQPDEAVLLAWVLLEKLPSRYGYLFDDSTDQASLPTPTLYAEEGVAAGLVRPTVEQVTALMRGPHPVIPIKSVVPFFLPRTDGAPQLIRLVERGPVMEVEIGDVDTFRNVLSRDEAERVAGYFLRLKLEQRVEIELVNS